MADTTNLFKTYKSAINPDFVNKFTRLNEINEKYQLAPGCEDDFNNAINFLYYAQTKHSLKIDENENEFSKFFGDMLLKYYNSYLTNDDIGLLCNYIHHYNKKIDDEYDYVTHKDPETFERVMTNIYGIDYTTFAIRKDSFAEYAFNVIKSKYVELVTKQKFCGKKDIGNEILNMFTFKTVDGETVIDSGPSFGTVKEFIANNYKKYGIYPVFLSTIVNSTDITQYIFVITDTKIYQMSGTGDVFEPTYSNSREITEEELKHIIKYDYANSNINTKNRAFLNADAGGKYSVPLLNDFIEKKYKTEYKSEYIADSYESNFLKIVTYDYILRNITMPGYQSIGKKVDVPDQDSEYFEDKDFNGLRIAGNYNEKTVGNETEYTHVITKMPKQDYENSEIVFGAGTKNETRALAYDIEIQIFSKITQNYNNITIGNLNDLYFKDAILANETYSSVYIDDGDTPQPLENYAKITENDESGSRYYISNAATCYLNNLSEVSIHTGDGNTVPVYIYDANNKNCVYENEILDWYQEYFKIKFMTSTDQDNPVFADYSRTDLYVALTSDIESVRFASALDTMKNVFKILYEFTDVSNTETINNLKQLEKRYSNSVESYHALTYDNLNFFILSNIVCPKESPLYKIVNTLEDDLYPDTTKIRVDGEQSIFSLSIIYKELNQEIREIDNSNIQNKILANYMFNSSANTTNRKITTDLYDVIKNNIYVTDIPEDDLQIFNDLHTNAYIIRNSVADDIVAYLAGETIHFGSSVTDKDDIQEILAIYKETRDYFYRVLLNKAFVNEDMYAIFRDIYVKAYTIERFIDSRINNLRSVDHFTNEDCRNFLISYGLKILSDQVDSNNFSNALSYKRRIIANYNNLMGKKGSRAVIDEFLKIFDYDTTELDLYKYLLLNKQGELEFISVPYNATNMAQNIQTYENKAKQYSSFIQNDPYWDSNEIAGESLTDIISSPVNTKYMGLELKKDIYISYIKAKYILSLNNYLYKNFVTNFTTVDNTKTFTNLLDKCTIVSDIFNNSEISINKIYKTITLLFALFIYLSEKHFINKSGNNPSGTRDSSETYYAINTENYINGTTFEFCSNTFLSKDLLKELFNCKYLKYDTDQNLTVSSDSISFYAKDPTEKIVPFNIISTENQNTLRSIIWNKSDTQLSYAGELDYIIPITRSSSISVKPEYTSLKYNLNDTNETAIVSLGNYLSSQNAIDNAFESVNLINFFNEYNNKHNTDATAETESTSADHYNKLKAIYFFNKHKSRAAYPDSIDELGRMQSDINLSSSNFYEQIFNKILSFPISYLSGNYGNHMNMHYTVEHRRILDEMFDKFFTQAHDSDNLGYLVDEQIPGESGAKTEFNNTTFISNCLDGFDSSEISTVLALCSRFISMDKYSVKH